jgi:alpha-beta hydrolase superfamily lysophospholipase
MIGGMSLGGTLALNYTLEALATDRQPRPDKVLLLAPAIRIDPSAALARYTRLVSWIPYFAQFGWNTIALEYDPFRYYSFPMNAIDQTYRLIQANNQLAAQQARQPENMAQMPSIIAFQTIVDATVSTEALIDWFAHYGTPDSTLVLFDINRALAPFLRQAVIDTHPTDLLTSKKRQALKRSN